MRRSLRRINKLLGDKNSTKFFLYSIFYLKFLKGTAQVKDIKPGVLSKVFALTERKFDNIQDENLKKLMNASSELQDCLLNYANYKPRKTENGTNQKVELDFNIKPLIKKIVEFK